MISIQDAEAVTSYAIYVMNLYQESSYWFIEGFDLREEVKQLFPVDKLINVERLSSIMRVSDQKINEKLQKQEDAFNVMMEIGPKMMKRCR